MLNRFSLYDFIAVLFPGIFLLWALGLVVDAPQLQRAIPLSGGLADTSVLVVVGYVTGLLLQGISQLLTERVLLWLWGGFPSALWLLPNDQRFSQQFKREIALALLNKFNISLETDPTKSDSTDATIKRNQEIFYRCYRSVEKQSDLPQTFNAQYGLFRGLLTTFVLLAIASLWKLGSLYKSSPGLHAETILVFGLFMVGAIVSYYRTRKRGEDFARAVYDVFLANFAGR